MVLILSLTIGGNPPVNHLSLQIFLGVFKDKEKNPLIIAGIFKLLISYHKAVVVLILQGLAHFISCQTQACGVEPAAPCALHANILFSS